MFHLIYLFWHKKHETLEYFTSWIIRYSLEFVVLLCSAELRYCHQRAAMTMTCTVLLYILDKNAQLGEINYLTCFIVD